MGDESDPLLFTFFGCFLDFLFGRQKICWWSFLRMTENPGLSLRRVAFMMVLAGFDGFAAL